MNAPSLSIFAVDSRSIDSAFPSPPKLASVRRGVKPSVQARRLMDRLTCVYFLTILATLPLCGALEAAEPIQRDIEYARIGDRACTLDLYAPTEPTTQPAPTIIWIHGGAWRAGSKSDVPVLRWRSHGFAIASVDYRLSPEAKFPAQVHDIKAAIRFLRSRAAELKLDPDRFVIAGASAGGHLAALVGVSSGVDELEGSIGDHDSTSSNVSAIVSFYGASNLQTILSQSTEHGLSVRVPASAIVAWRTTGSGA